MNPSARHITAALVLAAVAGTAGFVILQLIPEVAEPKHDLPSTGATAALESGSTRPDAPAIDPFGNAPVDLRPAPVPLLEDDQPDGPAITAATPAPAPVTDPRSLGFATAELPTMHVWFCTASSELTEPARAELTERLTELGGGLSGQELVVVGYSDTRGLSEPNIKLSAERAMAVAEFLRGMGLMVADFRGLGELEGLDDGRDCANQRRVDLWLNVGPAVTPSLACDLPTSAAVAPNCN